MLGYLVRWFQTIPRFTKQKTIFANKLYAFSMRIGKCALGLRRDDASVGIGRSFIGSHDLNGERQVRAVSECSSESNQLRSSTTAAPLKTTRFFGESLHFLTLVLRKRRNACGARTVRQLHKHLVTTAGASSSPQPQAPARLYVSRCCPTRRTGTRLELLKGGCECQLF